MYNLHSSKYSIEIGSLIESSFLNLIQTHYSNAKIILIVDENTHDLCLDYLLTSFECLKDAEIMLLPAGEENKVMEVCFQVWQAMSDYRIGRKDLIINLGGGMVTDMGGFIASIYKRGIDFIHIPTSLLAMTDASIGGKTGIDLGVYKNQLGTFNHPKKIYIDPIFLSSLPDEEYLNGFAEMLKHALISDTDLWSELIQIQDLRSVIDSELILKSVEIKFKIVESDPFEKNSRKLLNFGHTIGHAIEGFFLDKEPIPHGYAVVLGILAESYISNQKELLSDEELIVIVEVLCSKYPALYFEENMIDEIIKLTLNDKKNEGNKINCTLLKGIGSGIIDQQIVDSDIVKSLYFLNNLSKK